MAITFRRNPVILTNSQQNQEQQKKNAIGLSDNGQKVLNKTNKIANLYEIASTAADEKKRKENLSIVAKNTMLMPIMSDSAIGTAYTLNECKKGNISKDDAMKILAYNMIANGLA